MQMECLDPFLMFRDPDKSKTQTKCRIQTFLKDKQLTWGVSAGRNSFGRGYEPKFEYQGQLYSEFLSFLYI